MTRLRIFAASAQDMVAERAKVETVAATLKPLADHLKITLEVLDWRSVVPDAGRPEQVILDQLKPTVWDVFIGLLWHRIGTPPGGQDPHTQKAYPSGTVEEFKTAYHLWKQYGRPRVMMYRCTRAVPLDALDPEQYKQVKEFFEGFDATKGEHPGLYHSFKTTEAFERLLLDNLQKLLLDYGKQTTGETVAPEVVQALAPKVPDNLPRRASFFGRDKEMQTVLRALSPEDRTWGVLVDGIGGIGKTALATEAAHRCKEQGLFDAFVFVTAKQNILAPQGVRELTPPARTLDEFLNETARVLGQEGIPKLAGEEKRRALLDALRAAPTLLIYDNLETLTKEEQEAVAYFLRELPQGCKAIITSRRRGGEGAVWLRLEELEWEAARQLIAEEAKRDAGLNAKLQRAGEGRWQELYDATGGSPLALAHTLGLMRVRGALTFDGALEMLRGKRGDADLQQFVFQEARRELTTNDLSALRALSFFVPSATFEAWMDVAVLSRTELEITIDRLSALSLVNVLAGEERYALHPLTRNFVRDELLADKQVARETGMRFAGYWVIYAQRYGGKGNHYKTYNLIETEWANLEAAAEWLWQTAEVRGEEISDKDAAWMLNYLATNLCGAVGPLFYAGRWDESLQLSGRAYEAVRALEDWYEVGWCAYQIALVQYYRASTDEAVRSADRCVDAWKRSGNKDNQATGLRMRGMLARQRKDYNAAERFFQDALTIWRDLMDDEDTGIILRELGSLEHYRKHFDAAERYYREAQVLLEKSRRKESIAVLNGRLGWLAIDRGNWTEARELFEEELFLAREIGWQDSIAEAQYGLARVHEAQGQPDLALPLAQEALAIEERLHSADLPEVQEMVERLKKKMGEA
jgi:tetratricopeptide (TPR) repeat protein